MQRIRLLNRGLWALNAAIVVLIAAQVHRFITTVGTSNLAGKFEPIDPRPEGPVPEPMASFDVLLDLPNPIGGGRSPSPPDLQAELLGTLSRSAPEKGWAFFRSGRREFPVVLGAPLPANLRAWKVVEIGRGRAVLDNGYRRHTLLIE